MNYKRKWLDIEIAPRDGTIILGRYKNEDFCETLRCKWYNNNWMPVDGVQWSLRYPNLWKVLI